MITIANMKPRFHQILVAPMELPDEDTSSGGIVIPDNAEKDKPKFGRVIAVGEGRWVSGPDGLERLVPLKTKAGVYVTFGKYSGQKFRLGENYYFSMDEAEIICEVEGFEPFHIDPPAPVD